MVEINMGHPVKKFRTDLNYNKIDPVSKSPFKDGEKIVVCEKSGVIIAFESWEEMLPTWSGKCPYCNTVVGPTGKGGNPKGGGHPLPSRTPTPTWAYVLAGIGVFTFLIGILFIGRSVFGGGEEVVYVTNTPTILNPTDTVRPSSTVKVTKELPEVTATRTKSPKPTATARPVDTPRPTSTPIPRPTNTPNTGPSEILIGRSEGGRDISAIKFGQGSKAIVLIGGFHSGFAPSSVTVAEEFTDYFSRNINSIPDSLTVFVIPNANPDSAYDPGERPGRLNANGVDPNRNWDCNWQRDAVWRKTPINGGSAPFSENEARLLRDFIIDNNSAAIVFFEARAVNGMVSPGGCNDRVRVSNQLANIYSRASGYPVGEVSYEINGDSSNWLDSQGIPSVAILLPSYTSFSQGDWRDNLDGVEEILNAYR